MSRFPKLTETFVLYEMLALDALGIRVEVFPLLRGPRGAVQPGAERWVEHAHYHPFLSLSILRAQWHYLRRRPRGYLRTLREVMSGTWGNVNRFFGALAIFPKSVRFAYEVERQGVTHVHAHFVNHPTVAALIVHRLTGVPFSFTAHGSDLHRETRMVDEKVRASAFAVTVSEYNKEFMLAASGEDLRSKIHVIHCGIDLDVFRPARPCGNAAFQIVCVASFEEVKGHRYLVEACRILRDRGLAFECHLVGEGPLRREIESRIERTGLGGRIRLHGGQPRPEVVRLLSRVDAAVLASHFTRQGKREGIPVALMEAMATGLPVVATRISGIPELVTCDHNGILVPPEDAGALADALHRLAADPALRTRLGGAARRTIAQHFDLHANAGHLAHLFLANALPIPIEPQQT
jgi:glycosyltransferase involved in cell wall biosynthesis